MGVRSESTVAVEAAFPRAALYRSLTAAPSFGRIGERRAPGYAAAFSERHLQCAWFDPALRPARLVTADGEPVDVVDAGRWNLEAGPDFLDAVLLVGRARRRIEGDVEVHLRAGDWRRHGHHNDARYARVIAHACYLDHGGTDGDLPPGAVTIALGDALRREAAFHPEDLDVSAYPFARTVRTPPCNRILASWTAPQRGTLLDAAGNERLRRKALRMAAAIAERGPVQAFYEECMAALGYKHNASAFRTLARRVDTERLGSRGGRAPLTVYALLLGAAGLLPRRDAGADPETRALVRSLWHRWWKQASAFEPAHMDPSAWRLAGLRPQNHPARRLAAAAGLFAEPERLLCEIRALDPGRPADWRRGVKRLLGGPAVIPYWTRRLAFSGAVQDRPIALLGAARVAALTGNVILPFLAALGRPVQELWAHLPADAPNSLTRQAAADLFGRDHNPALYNSGIRRQGLLQIFNDFCISRRVNCPECPLAKALASHRPSPA